jgi:DNA-binding CsgD family transcriptional regulator
MFVSSSTRAIVARMLGEGLSMREAARRAGLAENTVRYHRQQLADARVVGSRAPSAGVPLERGAGPAAAPLLSPNTRDKVRQLLGAGYSRLEAAQRLGLSKSTVSYHARRLGMEMNAAAARRFDWTAIGRYYEEGHDLRECQARFGFSRSAWGSAAARGAVTPRPRGMPIPELLAAPRARDHLKRRLLNAGLLARACERCGISDWRGHPLALQLHHVNGDGRDNRLQNLQILCPNCHSQTGSWGGRNASARGVAGAWARPALAAR